jgi:O-antigen biosynthesis rhamnosyltransferase
MRVLHFYSTYYPDTVGGAEAAIDQICVATGKLGISSTVLTLSTSPQSEEILINGYKVLQCKTTFEIASTRFSISAINALRKLANENDLIHYHFPWPFADFCQIILNLKKPYVVTYHSDIVKQKTLLKFYSPIMHRFLKNASRIVATSPNYLESSETLTEYREKSVVIPLALSSHSFAHPNDSLLTEWKAKLGKEPFFLFVGVLRYYKGLHLLIEAARGTSLRVVIAGDGPEAKVLKAQATGLENVIFTGRISEAEKITLFTLARGFVFPSHLRSEAFGMSLLEAAMFSLPAICFEINTGTTYVVANGVTGIVIEGLNQSDLPSACVAFRAAMETLIANPGLAKKMGESAKLRMEKLFNVDTMGKSYANLYEEIALKPTPKDD